MIFIAGDQGGMHINGYVKYLLQHPIDPESHPRLILCGLDVDIAGPHVNRLLDYGIDQPHYRSIADVLIKRAVLHILRQLP
jgi:hypothetical protein